MEKLLRLSCLLLMLYASANTSIPGLVKDFIHVEKKMSWHDARKYCWNNSEDMHSGFDKNMMNLNGPAKELSWMGIFSINKWWFWVDGTSPSYFNWFGECTSMRKNGWWFTMSCNTKVSFVCNSVSGGWVLIKQNKTWHEAKLHCATYHSGLAFIHNATENSKICAVLQTDLYYWIGLATVTEYTPLNNSWRWVNNQSLTYSNWFTPLFCAVMDWRGFWHDHVCFEKNPFFCFKVTKMVPEYRMVNESKDFKDAQNHCKLYNMNLVMVKTLEENFSLLRQIQRINSSFVDGLYFWIGLENHPFVPLQSYPVFKNWNSMQPDGKDSMNQPIPNTLTSCAALKDGEWYDEACQQPLPFFCSATVRSMILVSEPKTWEEALDHCRDRYVDLASVGSDAEQQVAARKIKNLQTFQTGYVWIGLRFLAGSWFWVYGDNLQYKNWRDGKQQQCPVEHRCGAINIASGMWETRSCEERLNFLCFQE